MTEKTMTDTLALDFSALLELARRHPRELHKLRQSIIDALPTDSDVSTTDDAWIPCDRWDRALSIGSRVLTSQGERAKITRFDRNSSRALVELDEGGTRLLSLRKLELRRGRPRKDTYAVEVAEEATA